MTSIDSVEALEALYGTPRHASTVKVAGRLTPLYRAWIETSRFCVLSTVGPEGTDASPRGDEGPVVRIVDDRTLVLPDWRGNDRIDSLRNIVADGRASLMFFIPGSSTVVRVNGRAWLSGDAEALARFVRDGRRPRSVTMIEIGEVYFQCARAIVRARLWSGKPAPEGLPTAGRLLAEANSGAFDGASFEASWTERAALTLW